MSIVNTLCVDEGVACVVIFHTGILTLLTTAQSVSNNEILDYTGSPHHCVNVGTKESATAMCSTSWQDDYQCCQKEINGFVPPDPWGTRKQS